MDDVRALSERELDAIAGGADGTGALPHCPNCENQLVGIALDNFDKDGKYGCSRCGSTFFGGQIVWF